MKQLLLILFFGFLIKFALYSQVQPRNQNNQSSDGHWQELESPEGNFWAMLPGKASLNSTPIATAAGEITMHVYILDKGDVAYFIAYSDYPEAIIEESNSKDLLENVKSGAFEGYNSKTIISEEDIEINDYPAILSHVKGNLEGMPITFKGIHLIADNRLYQVYVLSSANTFDETSTDKFISSFIIRKEGWYVKTGDNGSFQFAMPGEPQFMNNPQETAIGKIDLNMYILDHGNVAWFASYSDFPPENAQNNSPDVVLDNAYGGAMEQFTSKKVLNKQQFKIDGFEALKVDVTGEMQGMNVRYKGFFAMVNNRLYQIYSLAIGDNYNEKDANYFEESFKLVKP